jgi:hypothetical protein
MEGQTTGCRSYQPVLSDRNITFLFIVTANVFASNPEQGKYIKECTRRWYSHLNLSFVTILKETE